MAAATQIINTAALALLLFVGGLKLALTLIRSMVPVALTQSMPAAPQTD